MTISPTAISDCQLLECVLIAVRALCRQQGYMAKGWLGLILGQSVWHAFFDAAIPTDETFDQQMDVSQEPVLTIICLGLWGRTHSVSLHGPVGLRQACLLDYVHRLLCGRSAIAAKPR